jgi:hypothetical protein
MIAFWNLIGGFAGIVRMAMGAAASALLFWLLIIPLEVREAKQGMVLEVRATAAEAKAAELERQVSAGRIVIDAYQVQLKNSRAAEASQRDEAEKRISEYEALRKTSGRSCSLDDIDRRFLLDLK